MRISDWSSDVCSSDLFTGYVAYLKDVKIAGPLSVWGSVGLATGYRRHDVLPIALIGPKLDVGQRAALRVGYAPKLGDVNDTHLVHFALELKLGRSEEHTSELQSLMRISYAVFCLKTKIKKINK